MASSPTQAQPFSQRLADNLCFFCRIRGHWAIDCPLKSPQKSQSQSQNLKSSSSSSSSVDWISKAPSFLCPKGHGTCLIRTSYTEKNPGRSFYTCNFTSSPNGKCGFFKWCDQVKGFEVQSGSNVKRDRSENYPDCGCGAGKCKVVREKGFHFYICSITKGHGACSFRKRVNSAMDVISGVKDGNQATNNNLSPKRTKLVSPVANNPEPVADETAVHIDDSKDIRDLSAINELARRDRERELEGFRTEKELQIYCSQSCLVQHRQTEFLRQMSLAEDENATGLFGGKDLGQQFISSLITGWLGRLLYESHPSRRGLIMPQQKPIFCCVFPSFNPIQVLKSRNEYDPSLTPWTVIPSQDPQSGVLLEHLSIQSVPGIRRGRDFTSQISRALVEAGMLVQKQLLEILESTEPSSHRSMEEAAEKTYSLLNLLSVDHALFSEHVREFIVRSRSVAEIETGIRASEEEIARRFDGERAKLEEVSRIRSETEVVVAESDSRLRLLAEGASLMEAMLLQIRNRVRECEAENAELRSRAREVSEEMAESERRLREAEAIAKRPQEEREVEHRAAMEALELAKARLQHTVIMV